ncbi:CDPK-related kinase 5-like [Senna tora]|uniref:non-specific serine/threonine protein kinase n=1 Tax=Senna tora TaxID=362788 RepID=A0A834U2P0_9FABA|nr:CDPK-related kinase 5-like [Senna tora]
MGLCNSKPSANLTLPSPESDSQSPRSNHIPARDNSASVPGSPKPHLSSVNGENPSNERNDRQNGKRSPFFPFYSPSPAHYLFSKNSPARSPANVSSNSTPKRLLKRSFLPPSPAKHIRTMLARRHGSVKPNEATILEGSEAEEVAGLDKSFGFSKHFGNKYEIGDEIGRGHFGYTCAATLKKGEMKGQQVAVKVIPKAKMTTAIAIEDVRREVKILRSLAGHRNLVQFSDAYEDHDNVYIVMELCEGGELLDRILSRGGKYTEDDAKAVMIQILNVVAFCHLQGVVHRDLKPENFLFTSKDDNSELKVIDFGLSDFVKPDERLNDIVGSAYYVAPEVLHRAYSTEADIWSVGVIAYILLCGSRPFWARTESGIFRAVLKADPSFDEPAWPSLSVEAKDFVMQLLIKDPRKRMTAAQALCHPWIKNYKYVKVPLDILIFKLMKAYMRSSTLRKAALRALSRTLAVDELFYLKEQFALLEPSKKGTISLENIKGALMKNATDAMKESRVPDFLASLNALQYRRMDFDEFCAAALSVHQLEALDRWEQHARCAYEIFEKDGNRVIVIEELASELGLGPSVAVHAVLIEWIRHTDGKLSFLGIRDGRAYTLYPRSSFIVECTGDVCQGDVFCSDRAFMKMTRHGRHMGKRTVAGRVVKESYGAAKQQHTFTVEVIWSCGVKKLPPLFPLLVKGRNLYKLKTYRQRWKNEAERVEVLSEKHQRGAEARLTRASRQKKKKYNADGYHCQSQHIRPSKLRRSCKGEKVRPLDGHVRTTFDCQPQETTSSRQVPWRQNASSRASRSTGRWDKSANRCQLPAYSSYANSPQSCYQSQVNSQRRNEACYEWGLIPSGTELPPLRPYVDVSVSSRSRNLASSAISHAYTNPRYYSEIKHLNAENVDRELHSFPSRTKILQHPGAIGCPVLRLHFLTSESSKENSSNQDTGLQLSSSNFVADLLVLFCSLVRVEIAS